MTELALSDERRKLALAFEVLGALPQTKIEPVHHFAQGVYARGGVIPAGVAFVGRVHKQSQINIISQGDITVLMETGVVRLKGPCTWVSPPGAQRAAYAHEETYWTTILATDKTDPQDIFDTLTEATFEDFQLAIAEVTEHAAKDETPCISQ